MSMKLRFLATLLLVPFVIACEPFLIPLYDLNDQPVGKQLTQEQVRAAINSGANDAGWSTEDAGSGSIVATYNIRTHMVVVDIRYSDAGYSINYSQSDQMKVHCSESEKKSGRIKITGPDICADGAKPVYIHKNYRAWVDQLNAAIARAIASA